MEWLGVLAAGLHSQHLLNDCAKLPIRCLNTFGFDIQRLGEGIVFARLEVAPQI